MGQDFVIEVEEPGGRMDQVLAQLEPSLSRTRWQELIKKGLVHVDGQAVDKPSHILAGGERVQAHLPDPAPSHLEPEAIPLDVLYEDEHVLVINKAAGMVVHPGAGHRRGTVVHAALAHSPDIKGVGGEKRPGVVHRLDKGTSGVLLLAKDDETHRFLQSQFKRRTVKKEYLALVDGHPPTRQGKVEAAIGRDPRYRQRMAVTNQTRGRPAQTTFYTVREFDHHQLLRLQPTSGRTHQLRVHLAFLGCPVVGDTTYGKATPSLSVQRQMLHAWQLSLRLRRGASEREFRAPLPDDFARILRELDPTISPIALEEGP